MSWVTLDRICGEEARTSETIRGALESNGRPLRLSAQHLSDEELLDKLRGFGLDLDRGGLEKLCEGALSAEEVAKPIADRTPWISAVPRRPRTTPLIVPTAASESRRERLPGKFRGCHRHR